jgi:hypothetical protein
LKLKNKGGSDMSKKKLSFSLKYVGSSPEADVPGLGVFPNGETITFEDPDKVDHAKELVKTNVNFEEVDE